MPPLFEANLYVVNDVFGKLDIDPSTLGAVFQAVDKAYIEGEMRWQRGYDSVDLWGDGKYLIDPLRCPAIASIVKATLEKVRGVVRIHMTSRDLVQIHTSHTDGMDFRERFVLHLGRDVLVGGEKSASSTGDVVFSGPGLRANMQLAMVSGRGYAASEDILCDKRILHGVLEPEQAALSIVTTIKPSTRAPATATAPRIFGPGVALGEVLSVTDSHPPPRELKARLRPAGHYLEGVSLLTSPPTEQPSNYHWLGTVHGGAGGANEIGFLLPLTIFFVANSGAVFLGHLRPVRALQCLEVSCVPLTHLQ